jgi:hypothetical protein
MLPLKLIVVYFTLFFLFTVGIAVVKASSAFTVVRPWARAQPAEFMTTLGTSHMHASLVLFNGTFAFWAGLGVGKNPGEILTFCAILQHPFVYYFTVGGTVGFFSAIETKSIATIAKDI